jgi:hypothetical protein
MVEIDSPVSLQLIQFLESLLSRQQHRVAKVTTACLIAKHVVEEQSLIDLVTVFLCLNERGFLGEARGGRAKTGDLLASQNRQFFDPAEHA